MGEIVHFPDSKKKQTPKPLSPTHHAETLSFMRRRKPRGSGIDYWVVKPTGDGEKDRRKGRELAVEYLKYLRQHPTYGNMTLLNCIVREMMDRSENGEKWSGIHMGFIGKIHELAVLGTVFVEREGLDALQL